MRFRDSLRGATILALFAAAGARAGTAPVAELRSLDFRSEPSGTTLVLGLSAPRSWASHVDADGELVIDLVEVRAGTGVTTRVYEDGPVVELRLANVGVPSRPVLRVIAVPRFPEHYRVETSPEGVAALLLPAGLPFPSPSPITPAPITPPAPVEPPARRSPGPSHPPSPSNPSESVLANPTTPAVNAPPAPAPAASSPAEQIGRASCRERV